METPREVVDRQVAAYNRRDIEAFAACYAPHAEIAQADGTPLAAGHDEIRRRYGELFDASPDLHVDIVNRIELESVIVDEERITGFVLPGMPTELHAAVVYRVAEGLIQGANILG